MTEAIFHQDASIREFDATVVESDSAAPGVVLDRTAFYPGGGGQPADRGELLWSGGSASVRRARWAPGGVVHVLEDASPAPGTRVHGVLDWERRYALMRTHTALHILCGVVWRDHEAQVTGGNMEPLSGRLDFEFEHLTAELVADLEEAINREVAAERDVRVAILPRAEAFEIPDLIRTKVNLLPESLQEIRTVEIVGLDLQADGGTHVANTREVGRIRVESYESKGRLNKRIRIVLDG